MARKKIEGQVEQPTDVAVQTDVSAAENQPSKTIATNDAVAAAVAQAYKVKPQDQKFVHVLQEIKRFDPHTSDRISRPVVQMYGVREWDKIADYLKRQGHSLQVIHHPGK